MIARTVRNSYFNSVTWAENYPHNSSGIYLKSGYGPLLFKILYH